MTAHQTMQRAGGDKSASCNCHQSALDDVISPVQTQRGRMMHLQRTLGNQAMMNLIAQRKLDPTTGTLMREGETEQDLPPLEPISTEGEGTPEEAIAINYARSISLEGKTEAHFDGSSQYQVKNANLSRSTGCEDCGENDPCVSINGTLTSTYNVPTTVTLPDLSSMDLTDCEREQAQNWIDTVLAPHEQEHVREFSTYNGTTNQPIRIQDVCQSGAQDALDTQAETMHNTEQNQRQTAAQAASDALDPFNSDIEIDCPEPEEQAPDSDTSDGTGGTSETAPPNG